MAQQGRTGLIVHVRYHGTCYAGMILDPGRSARVRLFRPSSVGNAGHLDTEGDYRHELDPLTVEHPDGSIVTLPTWHPIAGCPR